MKVETAQRDIQRSDSFTEKAMGLAKGSEAFVFNVLRKDLYSDPIGSLIREYTVNAQDEHRKFGKTDVPILIQVPNHFTPELHIRDYAGGLTEEQVFEFFGNYGASDKRDSNVAVGFFGLGCKSAFAYTDSYIVKSFKDGVVRTFNIYIDETEIGKTAKISEEPTTEPNGIEIIVPVKTHDINTFQRKVISTVRYFKTKPTITGMDYEPDLNQRTSVIKGEGWEFFGRGTPTVIMGEIPYPVDRYKMGDNLENWEAQLLQSDLNIYVGIGDVQVTASREALQMSQKTIDAVRQKLVAIKDSMVAETQKAFANATSLIEAKQLWDAVVEVGGGYSHVIRSLAGDIKWKGQEIKDKYIKLDAQFHFVTVYETYRRRGYDKVQTYTITNLSCDNGEKFYFDDTDGKKVGYMRRARTLMNAGARKVTIIHTTDKTALETLFGMPVTKLESFNAVAQTVATSTRQRGTGVDASKKAKHLSKVFVLDVAKLKGHYGAASEVWEVKEVDTTLGGVYIPIDRFKPTDLGRIWGLDDLCSVLHAITNAGISIDVPIYGIKKGGDTAGLTRFDEWLDATVKSNKDLIEHYGMVKAYTQDHLFDVSNLFVEKLPDGSIAKQYATLYKKVKNLAKNSDSKFRVFRYTKVDAEPDETVGTLSKQFGEKYPMLKFVDSWSYKEPEVINYIAERDAEGEKSLSQTA